MGLEIEVSWFHSQHGLRDPFLLIQNGFETQLLQIQWAPGSFPRGEVARA